ncbi:MAG TPA: putative porin, partial [Roseivirga sp.]
SFLFQQYNGQQKSWDNSFGNESSDNIRGTIKLNSGSLSFRPFLRFSRISNYLYFDENRLPAQANSDVILLTPGFNFDLKLSQKITWSSELHYNNISGGASDLYRLPEVLVLSQLAYRNEVFGGKMIVHTGIEAHYRTAYEALDYDPIIQQFYLQNGFENDAFVKADVFLNFKVGNFLFLLKMAHLNQSGFNGYFITPEYAGVKRTLDMGVRWLFFD